MDLKVWRLPLLAFAIGILAQWSHPLAWLLYLMGLVGTFSIYLEARWRIMVPTFSTSQLSVPARQFLSEHSLYFADPRYGRAAAGSLQTAHFLWIYLAIVSISTNGEWAFLFVGLASAFLLERMASFYSPKLLTLLDWESHKEIVECVNGALETATRQSAAGSDTLPLFLPVDSAELARAFSAGKWSAESVSTRD